MKSALLLLCIAAAFSFQVFAQDGARNPNPNPNDVRVVNAVGFSPRNGDEYLKVEGLYKEGTAIPQAVLREWAIVKPGVDIVPWMPKQICVTCCQKIWYYIAICDHIQQICYWYPIYKCYPCATYN